MADASINEVVKKLTEISETIKKLSGASASTYSAQQEKYRAEYESRAKQPETKQQQDNSKFIRSLSESLFGNKLPGNLSTKEQQRYKKIGDILKPIFNAAGIAKSIDTFSSKLFELFEQQHRDTLTAVSPKSDTKTKDTKDAKTQPKKQSWFESIVSNIGPKLLGGAALLAIGMGIAHLAKSAGMIEKVDTKTVLAFSAAFGAMAWGLYKLLNKIKDSGDSMLEGALAFGAVALALNKYIVPSLQDLATIQWDDIKGGVAALGIVLGSMVTTMVVVANGGNMRALIGKGGGSSWSDVLKNSIKTGVGIGAIYSLVSILHHELVPTLIELSAVKWDQVKGGLAAAGIALGGITAITSVIAAMINSPNIAGQGKNILTAIASGGIVYGLIKLMGELGDQMQNFGSYDWNSIQENVWGAEKALAGFTAIAAGVGALLQLAGPTGVLFGGLSLVAIAAITANIGYVADNLAKYSAVDANKLKDVGESLMPLAKGMGTFLAVFGVGGIASAVSNTIDSIMSIFNRDVVGAIIRFESINDKKIAAVGESLKLLSDGLVSILKNSAISASGTREAAKATSELIDALSTLKTYIPNNTLQFKITGEVDRNTIAAIDKLATDIRDIRSISLQPSNDKLAGVIDKMGFNQIKLEGISELQKIIKDLNTAEINLLTEQRDILKDVRATLRESNTHLQMLSESGTVAPATMSKSRMREERSFTRDHYLQNSSLFEPTIK